jgi:outer membrane cobalamin receptor
VPVTVTAGQVVTADFALSTEVFSLDELVVAGTIVESRRRELSVPVGVIEEAKIRTPSRTRIDQLFRGDIPGIIGIEGSPTQSGAYMFVRGRASLDTENLVKVYVDGVEAPTSSLISSIDLQNVKRMELLRGPQASTIYGSNASGGVLLIFTKDGVAGGPRLSGDASAGTTASDYVSDAPLTMEHRLNLSGGGESFTYSVGGSFNSAGDWVTQGDSRQAGFTGRGTFTQGPFRFSLSSMYSNRVLGWADPPGAAVLAPLFPE